MRVVTLDQQTPEWLMWRAAGVGSSDAPVIVNGKHFERTRNSLWLEKTGRSGREEAVGGGAAGSRRRSAMRRGQELEPRVRAWYERATGYAVAPLCCVHDTHEWMKGSLDGWVDPCKVVLEIKAPNRDDHRSALDQAVPRKYVPQVNHLCLVSGATFCHYVSYNNYFPEEEQYALVPYAPDAAELGRLLAMEELFWHCVRTDTDPDHFDWDSLCHSI